MQNEPMARGRCHPRSVLPVEATPAAEATRASLREEPLKPAKKSSRLAPTSPTMGEWFRNPRDATARTSPTAMWFQVGSHATARGGLGHGKIVCQDIPQHQLLGALGLEPVILDQAH